MAQNDCNDGVWTLSGPVGITWPAILAVSIPRNRLTAQGWSWELEVNLISFFSFSQKMTAFGVLGPAWWPSLTQKWWKAVIICYGARQKLDGANLLSLICLTSHTTTWLVLYVCVCVRVSISVYRICVHLSRLHTITALAQSSNKLWDLISHEATPRCVWKNWFSAGCLALSPPSTTKVPLTHSWGAVQYSVHFPFCLGEF